MLQVLTDDGEVYQTETLAFMALADAHDFVISANFHGGTELVNYPFDNARTNQYVHADTDWFEHVGVEYATHCQTNANAGTTSTPPYSNKPSYMTDDDDWDASGGLYPNNYIESPGVTHGAEWYRVYGGRQDYMNYYQQCREITIELSDDKILAENKLDDYWYYNKDALLDFLTQGTYGFRGLVLDANTSNPIEDVKVTVVGHDAYNSEIYTDNHGAYYRPIKGGTYSLLFESPCYQSFTMSSQSISDGSTVQLSNVLLIPIIPSVPNSLSATGITTTSANLSWTSTATAFDLRYKEVGASSWIDVLGLTTNSHDLTGLSAGTNYEFEVRANCNTAFSVYSSSYSFTTPSVNYCASQGNDFSDEFISRVQLNTIDNDTGAQGYSDFTNISTTLITGESYTITVTPEWTGTTYSEGYRVWIDYNKDGSFTNAERVMNLAPTQNTPVSATFTIPESVILGTTRMRVSMRYNTRPSSCGTFDYGEVEDYTINLFDGLVYSANTWRPNAPNNSTGSENVLVENGIYNVNSSDISMNNLTVNAGATINVDKSSNVTVAANITNNGELILNSDSNEFSSLMVDGSVSGNVKYNRHVSSNAEGNDIIAAPVSGEAFTSFITNNSNILSNSGQTQFLFGPFEKPLNDYTLYSNTESATLDTGNGYRAASTNSGTFTFEGNVTTGALTVPIIKTGADFAKWNLIGNPYTTYIKLEDFLNANLNILDAQSVAIYGYDADDSDGSVWSIWNMAYSLDNPGSLIAPGQGFFVSSKDGGSNVIFNPSMRSTGTSDDFMAGRNSNLAHFIISMSRPDKTSNTDIYFENNATLGLDIGYDAELFEEEPSPFAIYSELTEDGQDLNMAIQTIGFDDINGSNLIPLGINLLQGEQVTISMETADLQYDVYLEDTQTNTITFLNSSDYNMTAETDLFGTGRFYLRFETETLTTATSNLDTILVYNDSGADKIVVKGEINEDTVVVIFDTQGREIKRADLFEDTTLNTIDTSSFSNGVYLIQLKNTESQLSKKIIVR